MAFTIKTEENRCDIVLICIFAPIILSYNLFIISHFYEKNLTYINLYSHLYFL